MTVPSELSGAFRRFRRDFDQVTATWLICGEESEASVQAMRDGVRGLLEAHRSPARDDTLAAVFAFWAELASRVCPHGVAVRPVLSVEGERKARESVRAGR